MWRRFFRSRRSDSDLEDELSAHIEFQMKKHIANGMSRDEAYRRARIEFGGLVPATEECRSVNTWEWLDAFSRSSKQAVRSLRRTPGFTVLAIAILTLGIGASTAMFSVTRTVLLKPLAYADPERLVTITFRVPEFSKILSTIPANAQHYLLWRDHSRTIQEIAVLRPDSGVLTGAGKARQVMGVSVSANFFHLLGFQPALGRLFSNAEDQPGRDGVVIISRRFWDEDLGGRPDVLGNTIRIDGRPFQIIGVMPAGFPMPRGREISELEQLPEHTDYWRPLVFSKEDLATPIGNENYLPFVRLKPGVSLAQAYADVTALEKVIAKRYPEPVLFDPVVRPLQQAMAREVRRPLVVLMAAVLGVMLIVCINLMNLMTVRAVAQRREWGIRLAIGAGVRDLLSGALLQSLLLSAVGAVFGSLLAIWFIRLVRLKAPIDLPRIDELSVDPVALVFAVGLAIASALLFGLWPAWRAAGIDPQETLQSGGRSSTEDRKAHAAGRVLVAAEIALSTVLLLTSGLLLRSYIAILNVDPGLDVHNQLTVRIDLPPQKYREQTQMFTFYQRLLERVLVLPGVQAAGYVCDLPLTGENNNNPVTAADRPIPPLTQWAMTNYRFASSSYFRAAGIPLKSGRVFEQRDGAAREVLISSNLAERLWPGESPIGRPVKLYGSDKPVRVIGVVGAVHAASLIEPPTMMIYFPDWLQTQTAMSLVVRTTGESETLSAAIRRAIVQLEPEAAIPRIETMREIVSRSLSQKRFQLTLLIAFAITAVLLASLGVYGVLSFATTRRTPEIGVRIALGARPGQILRMTVGNGIVPATLGLVAGVVLAAISARLIQNLLFQVQALDPLVYASACLLILSVAALASYAPARRASRLNPIEALRHE
ncbi:MAG: ABC transporter permease [Acidobacteriaceae bacterium]|nr:ABC transporter permease [Acidobacteriaceae bacterium]